MMNVVRAHSNYFTDTVSSMWCELFSSDTLLNCNLRCVGIFDECSTYVPRKAMHNVFTEYTKQRLYLSAGRTHIALVTKLHRLAEDEEEDG